MRTLVFLLLVGGCAGEVQTTPAESSTDPNLLGICTWWQWCPHKEVPENATAYRGEPAWANDGSNDALGVWTQYERKLGDGSDDPFAFAKRNFQWQLFSVTPGRSTPAANGAAWRSGEAVEVYYMKSAGYALVKVLDRDNARLDFYRAPLGGGAPVWLASQDIASMNDPLGYNGDVREVVPSPDGLLAADVLCHVSDSDGNGGFFLQAHPPCTVRFLDMQSATVTQAGQTFTLTLATQLAYYPPEQGQPARQKDGVLWSRSGVLVVTDQAASAFAVGPNSAPTSTALPACAGPNTSSSKISLSGQRLGVQSGKIQPVAPTEFNSTFGCL
jgi:hypothetical protein